MKQGKLVALALSMLLLLSCSDTKVEKPTITGDYIMPDSVQIAVRDCFRTTPDNADTTALDYQTTFDSDAQKQWEAYMSDLWGTSVSVPDYDESYRGLFLKTYSGLIKLFSVNIQSLADRGLILPIEEYLADNAAWNKLPEDFRNLLAYNGHIWGVPVQSYPSFNVLSIRTDWLKNVNKSAPTTLEEFQEVGKSFLRYDANGDGQKNDSLMGGYYAGGISSHLLQSYGLYTSNGAIGYDPVQKKFVDALYQPQAKEVLQTLREMINEGIIDSQTLTNPIIASRTSAAGSYGTFIADRLTTAKYESGAAWTTANAQEVLGHVYDPSDRNDYSYATGLYEAMPPLSKEYPLTYTQIGDGFVLSAGTQDPQGVVNAFVDMLYSSPQCFLDFYLGVPGNYEKSSDSIITLKYQDPALKLLPTNPQLLYSEGLSDSRGGAEIMLGDHFVVLTPDQDKSRINELVERKVAKRRYEEDYIEKYTQSGQLVKIPSAYTYLSIPNSKIFQDEYKLVITSLDDKHLTIDEILETYQRHVTQFCNVSAVLEQLNQSLTSSD